VRFGGRRGQADLDKQVIGEEETMRKILTLLAVSGLLVAVLAAPAGADPDARPFKAVMYGELSWQQTTECPGPVLTHSEATGQASHLGRSTMTGDHCTPAGNEYGPGAMTLVAANGDEVHMEYHGVCPPWMDLPIGEVLTCSLEFEIVGGTGRFADATGEGSGTASLVWLGIGEPRTAGWWAWNGTIGY
jgi:hypothetical protein